MLNIQEQETINRWRTAFADEGVEQVLAFRLEQMVPQGGEIPSSKLVRTRAVLEAAASGAVTLIRQDAMPGLQEVIDTLRAIATHARIARRGDLLMRPPAFWVRLARDGSRSALVHGNLRPALPVIQLETITGFPRHVLDGILRLLLEDEAIQVVRSRDGVKAVLLCDGFVSDDRIRPLLA